MSLLTLSAKLDRTDSGTPWGFRLHGGKDFSSVLTIQRVTPGSLAAKCGLQVGDEITKINETPTEGLFHKEAQQRIITAGNSLELSIQRGGSSHRPTANAYTPSQPSPVQQPSPVGAYNQKPQPAAGQYNQDGGDPAVNSNYNVKPKPFTPGGGGTVPVAMNNQYNTPINMYSVPSVMNSLTTQTAQMNVGSTGNEEVPPPLPATQPPPLHDEHVSSPTNTHDLPPAASSLSMNPSNKSPGGLYETRATPQVTQVTPPATDRVGVKPSPPLVKEPSPTQSAVHEVEESHEGGGAPRYRGYTNPQSQSRSFKILQEKIDSGEDFKPALGRSDKGPIVPVTSKPTDDPDKYVKAIMNRQYNTPAGLYSQTNAEETFTVQASKLMKDMEQREGDTPDTKKTYIPSDTYKMVQEEEVSTPATKEGIAPGSQKRGAFNPVPAYQKQPEQTSPSYRQPDQTTSSYKQPDKTGSYRPGDVGDRSSPVYKPTYKSSASPALYKPSSSSPTYNPTTVTSPTVTSPTYHSPTSSDDITDTVVLNRATITITPKSVLQDSSTKEPSIRNTSPRPFITNNNNNDKPVYKNPGSTAAPTAPGGGGGTWKPSIPTGPRNMKVGRMGEARSMPGGQAGRIPMCNGCGVAIRGPFVLALDKSWCPNHFNCANPDCGRPLIDCGFVEEDGKLYCEKDYEQFLAPRCGKCGGAIVGEIVNAMKNTYHMNCFLCGQCHQPIGSASFHIEDGKIYCEKDWAALFQTKCYGCQFPIEPGDKWVEALGQNWHSECFNCSTCQVNLEGQPFYAKAGKPFCKKHAMGGGRF